MTDSSTTPPPGAPPRRLTRSVDDRMIAGVCGGLAEYTGIDPVVFRVVAAVAALLGGAGVAAYLVAWLVVPKAGSESHIQAWAGSRARDLPRWAAIALGVAAVFILSHAFDGHGPFFHGGFGLLILVAFAVWLWMRHDDDGRRPAPAAATWTAPTPPPVTGAAGSTATETTAVVAPPAAAPARRRRPRSVLPSLAFSGALVVAGILAAISAGSGGVSTGAVFAGALITVGAGLLVGSRWGHARRLIPLGVVLVVATAVATVADVPFRGGAGERTWRPLGAAELDSTYRLGAGHATLDLRDLALDGHTRSVTVTVAVGHLEVWLPSTTNVRFTGHVGAGRLDGIGDEHGTDITRTFDRVDDQTTAAAGTVVIDAKLGFGLLEVHQ